MHSDFKELIFLKQNENEENHALENINIGLCEIIVDHNDPLQWEIKTSNSKKWFMKAHSTNERQKWIQALGEKNYIHIIKIVSNKTFCFSWQKLINHLTPYLLIYQMHTFFICYKFNRMKTFFGSLAKIV